MRRPRPAWARWPAKAAIVAAEEHGPGPRATADARPDAACPGGGGGHGASSGPRPGRKRDVRSAAPGFLPFRMRTAAAPPISGGEVNPQIVRDPVLLSVNYQEIDRTQASRTMNAETGPGGNETCPLL